MPERDILAHLTDPQRQAVTTIDGPLLVLAGAGSGKTRVITRRIAHLIELGVPPWAILALTFTNKAAAEMRERVIHLLEQQGRIETDGEGRPRPPRGLTVTTFHALCARLLRRYASVAELPGVKPDFSIYDTNDQTALMKRVLTALDLSSSNWPPRAILSAISNAKNELKDARAYEADANDFYARTIARIYKSYEAGLRSAGAVDFDDLLLLTVRMLQTCEPARTEIQERWRFLLIDEYQDTNRAQFLLASIIAENPDQSPPNICAVGDPDQSIYGWRGADIRNILEFEEHYPDAQVIPLGQNFRSKAPILAAADALIRHNQMRKHKDLFTADEGGEKPEVILCRDEHHEADVVVDWLKARKEEGDADWKDMAVFYRTNALSRVLEDALRSAGLPYVIARGTAFFEREEVRNAIAYLRVVANPSDDVSLARIVNRPARGIGAATLSKAEMIASERGLPLIDALRACASESDPASRDLSSRARNALTAFLRTLDDWSGQGTFLGGEVEGSLAELVERVVKESGLEKHYRSRAEKSGEAPDEDRLANLDEVISSAAEFEQTHRADQDPAADLDEEGNAETPPLLMMLRAFLESVALVADADKVDPASGAVTLMTLHAAKGLEFPAVAMVGLEDGLLPHSRARESEAELEEERRLCFVGITRAMRRLLMTSARRRTHRGVPERTIPSQFLDELPREHVMVSDQSESYDPAWDDDPWGARGATPTVRTGRRKTVATPGGEIETGARVRHPHFGEGAVLSITRAGPNTRAQIRFSSAGVKTLVLRYANLERLA